MGLTGEGPPGSLCPGLQPPLFVEHFRMLGREGQGTVGGPLPAAVRYKVGCEIQRGRGGARHVPHPLRKEAGQAQPEERAQEGTPGGVVPHTGGHCPAVLGPPEAATASRKSHPRPVPGVQWKGRGHHDKPRAGPREPRGLLGQASRPLAREGAAPASGEAGSRRVAGSQHLVPLIDCFQRSEERLAPDSGVSEARLCLAHPQCLGTRG